jgi:hypothetical protein
VSRSYQDLTASQKECGLKPEYAIANDNERARLDSILDRLTDEDLARRLPNGLTIATALVHLAFWDEYARAALQQWRTSGFSDSRTNYEAVNSAVLTLAADIPDRSAVEMLRRAADAVDREAGQVSPELAEIVQANGKHRVLERAMHRRTHLDQIESLLAQA